ncbi:MAG: type II toxin-antitoxin system RelE/ParE family toxin [Dehalococcoidia bacterium]|nr:type II toxin-antitoxin system RelE/ParE family toxin [Dehalococcoidia bacterium]MCL2150379.1 type II toxin-antitoxin system RelE/ParE family toxin [Dehalococcoidia bacterium]
MEQYDVVIADRAKTMLGTHIKFLARVNLPAALDAKARILATIRSLNKMPERYPFFDEDYIPRGKYHKAFAENWYLILYQIKDRVVYVDYVVDCRQDYKWLVR